MNTNAKRESQALSAILAFSLNISASLEKMAALPKIERNTKVPETLDIVEKKLQIYAEIMPDVIKLNLCASTISSKDIDKESLEILSETLSETRKVAERFLAFAEICRDFATDTSLIFINRNKA